MNEDLAVQKVKVTKRTEEVELLLKEIAAATAEASEKKELAIIKGNEIKDQTKVIDKEKVFLNFFSSSLLIYLINTKKN